MVESVAQRRTSARARAGAVVVLVLGLVSCGATVDTYRAVPEYDPTGRRRDREPTLLVEVAPGETGGSPEGRAIVTSPWLPGMELRGIVEVRGARTVVYITAARLFANWANGWTEGHYEASGILGLTPRAGSAGIRVAVSEPIELWTLERGEIRYYDSYFRGDTGVGRVRARVDRLEAVAEWLRSGDDPGVPGLIGDARDETSYGPAAVDLVWRRVRAATAARGLPDWLRALEESESLHRDLREAPGLLVALANLQAVNAGALDGTIVEER